MQRLATQSLAPADASATNVAQAQTPGSATNLTLNGSAVSGGVATFTEARRVLVTTVSDESGKTLTIYGTDRNGQAQTEVMTGPNATTGLSNKDFKTVTRVAVSAAFTGNVSVGTGGKLSTGWFVVDRRNPNLGFAVRVSGTINYTIEHTLDDPFSSHVGWLPDTTPEPPYLTPYPHATIAAKTAGDSGAYTGIPISAARLTINSYSTGATAEVDWAPGGAAT